MIDQDFDEVEEGEVLVLDGGPYSRSRRRGRRRILGSAVRRLKKAIDELEGSELGGDCLSSEDGDGGNVMIVPSGCGWRNGGRPAVGFCTTRRHRARA